MFLDSMTADVAAQHGHDFSVPRSPSPALPLHRSALNAVLAAVAFHKSPLTLTPSKDDDVDQPLQTLSPLKTPMAVDLDTISHASDDSAPSRPSSSCASVDNAECIRRAIRQPRSKTTFNLAHPPPATRQKLHVRPRVLLQLHKAVPGSRPKPEYEIVPSMRCAPRIARKFGRLFKAMEKLGPDDVVVMKADSYGPIDDSNSSDDDLKEEGEPIGVVCVSKSVDGKSITTEICMDDNSVWEATCLRNGNYEFKTKDAHGLEVKSRWVARLPRNKMSGQSLGQNSASFVAANKKFNFSTISADSRRHPVIASMTPSKIDIQDQYSLPAKTDSRDTTPQVTPSVMSDAGSYMESQNLTPGESIHTDEALRKFILVTGVYVAFRENWSAAFQYTQGIASPVENASTRRRRATSLSLSDSASVISSTSSDKASRTLPRFFRSNTPRSRPTIAIPGTPTRASTLPTSPGSNRSSSSGSAYLQKASSKRYRKRASLPPDLAEAEEESESERDHSSVPTPIGSALHTPKATIARPFFADEGERCDKDAEVFTSPRTITYNQLDSPRVQSAYLPRESTKNLWDSGEPDASCKKPKKMRSRPTSLIPFNHNSLDGESKLKRQGSLRRVLSIFKGKEKAER